MPGCRLVVPVCDAAQIQQTNIRKFQVTNTMHSIYMPGCRLVVRVCDAAQRRQ